MPHPVVSDRSEHCTSCVPRESVFISCFAFLILFCFFQILPRKIGQRPNPCVKVHLLSLAFGAGPSQRIQTTPVLLTLLKGNSTLKNILPKINIYDKWSYVSVIKLTMQIRYRIGEFWCWNCWFRAMFSSMEAEVVGLAVYFYIYVCLLMLTWLPKNCCSYVLSCVKTCVVSAVWQEIPQSFDPHLQPFSIRNAFINNQQTVNDARVTSFVTSYHWRA